VVDNLIRRTQFLEKPKDALRTAVVEMVDLKCHRGSPD
jgi:hypothetical protein